ncbi:MAG TPA: hypothetical protein VMD75_03760 [Candidatus Binataceae bacterium]|nr:hypothetical protein [Candidatus Binataceae bacterium]
MRLDYIDIYRPARRDPLAEALGAVDLRLSSDDLATIERAMPKNAALGDRYPARAMADLDSEK